MSPYIIRSQGLHEDTLSPKCIPYQLADIYDPTLDNIFSASFCEQLFLPSKLRARRERREGKKQRTSTIYSTNINYIFQVS
jgi:hypothetical protein